MQLDIPAPVDTGHSVADIILNRLLVPHFQPIVDMVRHAISGYESLIRGTAPSPLQQPAALFSEARRQGIHADLELACAQLALQRYCDQQQPARLFINMSSSALSEQWRRHGDALPELIRQQQSLPAERIVIEITEEDAAEEQGVLLQRALASLRAHGMLLAIDDYGSGRNCLRFWDQVQPEIVKIDRYFFDGIGQNEKKQKLVQSILAIGNSMGTQIVAEGIETEQDLLVTRELGIRYVQGWFLGYPSPQAIQSLPPHIQEKLENIALKRTTIQPYHATVHNLRISAPAVRFETDTNDHLHKLFIDNPGLHAAAVINAQDRPVGIVNRRDFSEHYAQQFIRELYGRKSCSQFMNANPVLVDGSTTIESLSHLLISKDQRYLVDGFIITHQGRYDGLGTGEALVKEVTEKRIEAARYANPLTSLPGNIPISHHIASQLDQEQSFVTAYCDLNNFKPFNDVYGYWRGDDMIRLCAEVIKSHCNPQQDFIGHVGGDDFIIVFGSSNWEQRAHSIINDFNLRAQRLYDHEDQSRGGIEAEDRHGINRFFPFVSLGMGAVYVDPTQGDRIQPQDIASAAARVKHRVKKENLDLVVESCLMPITS